MQKLTKKRYVVFIGRKVGVYKYWSSVKKQVVGYPCAWYRRYKSEKDAKDALAQWKNRQKMSIKELLRASEREP